MKLKKLAALLLTLALCLLSIPAFGTAAETETRSLEVRIAEQLDFVSRLHELKQAYSLRIADKAEAMNDPFANARLIVKYAGELDYSGSVAHVAGYNDWHVIQYASAEQAKAAQQKYLKLEGVAYAAPDGIVSVAQTPHQNSFLSWGFGAGHVDAFNYNEWILEEMDLDDLPEIIVGICDTGIDSDHEFLVDSIVPGGWDFVNNDNNPEDEHYHGTHVAGTVVDGTLPNVKVMGLRVLDAQGYGDTSDIVNGMEYAYLHGCKVVNLSLRGPRNDQSEQLYSEVINNGTDSGTVYCIASGNDGGSSEDWLPGSVRRSFTVAAHDTDRSMAYFSNTGPSVDITAPGVNIRSAAKGGGYRNLDGTSMATPHVAAACAMVLSFVPDMDPDTVIDTLKAAAVPANFTGGGTGTLNVTDLFKYDPVLNGEGSSLHFKSSGNYPWAVADNYVYSSNSGVNNSSSVLTSTPTLGAYQRISFDYKCSSEQGHDFLRFKVNGNTVFETSGEQNWQTYTGLIPASGSVQLSWEFVKDASGAAGSDAACLRNVIVEKTISTVINGEGSDVLFETAGNYPWVIDGDCAKSGNAGVNNSVSEVSSSLYIESGLTVLFSYKTECGQGDKLQFLVDGSVVLEVGSTTGWTAYEYTVETSGNHTLAFRYVKDGSGSVGGDCARIKGFQLIHSISSALNVTGGHLVFTNGTTYPWIVEGNYAKSGNAGFASTTSSVYLEADLVSGDQLTFRYRVSSEQNYDKFYFYANGSQQFERSGNVSWTEYTYTVPSNGHYTFEWRYTKDYSVNSGDDAAYLDDVALITSEPQYLLGDVDGNGEVTVTDALLALRYAMHIVDLDETALLAGDVDYTGDVTVTDALLIMRYSMGLLGEF